MGRYLLFFPFDHKFESYTLGALKSSIDELINHYLLQNTELKVIAFDYKQYSKKEVMAMSRGRPVFQMRIDDPEFEHKVGSSLDQIDFNNSTLYEKLKAINPYQETFMGISRKLTQQFTLEAVYLENATYDFTVSYISAYSKFFREKSTPQSLPTELSNFFLDYYKKGILYGHWRHHADTAGAFVLESDTKSPSLDDRRIQLLHLKKSLIEKGANTHGSMIRRINFALDQIESVAQIRYDV